MSSRVIRYVSSFTETGYNEIPFISMFQSDFLTYKNNPQQLRSQK